MLHLHDSLSEQLQYPYFLSIDKWVDINVGCTGSGTILYPIFVSRWQIYGLGKDTNLPRYVSDKYEFLLQSMLAYLLNFVNLTWVIQSLPQDSFS